jgi:hypothetical protein
MTIRNLKLENENYHNYFVQTVYEILTKLNFSYTIGEIEKMSIEERYSLYFHNKKTRRWHLGIWAVGEWGIKEEIDGDVINAGYGIDSYKPKSICVFLIHDWDYDKFRPTYANWQRMIEENDNNIDVVVNDLKYCFKHPIDSYYTNVEEDKYNFQHIEKNKYIAYFKAWYRNVLLMYKEKKKRRILGYIATKIFTTKAFFDKRIAHCEYKFHKDKWNDEYEVAIVAKYGETEWDDWKVWSVYDKLFEKLHKWNIWVSFTYVDENGNIPDNIWRGVYWEEEPEK